MTAALWTKEQVEQLHQLAGTKSYAEIGDIIGKSKDAVKSKLYSVHRVRRASRKKKDVEKVEARQPMNDLYKNPHSKKYVARDVVSKLEYCKTCHSPVSSWEEHTSRLGCKRNAQAPL